VRVLPLAPSIGTKVLYLHSAHKRATPPRDRKDQEQRAKRLLKAMAHFARAFAADEDSDSDLGVPRGPPMVARVGSESVAPIADASDEPEDVFDVVGPPVSAGRPNPSVDQGSYFARPLSDHSLDALSVVEGPRGERSLGPIDGGGSGARQPGKDGAVALADRFDGNPDTRRCALAAWLPVDHADPTGRDTIWNAKEVPAVPHTLVAVMSIFEPQHATLDDAMKWRMDVLRLCRDMVDMHVTPMFVSPHDGTAVWCACCCPHRHAPIDYNDATTSAYHQSTDLQRAVWVHRPEMASGNDAPKAAAGKERNRDREGTKSGDVVLAAVRALQQDATREAVHAVQLAHTATTTAERLKHIAERVKAAESGSSQGDIDAANKRCDDAYEEAHKARATARVAMARFHACGRLLYKPTMPYPIDAHLDLCDPSASALTTNEQAPKNEKKKQKKKDRRRRAKPAQSSGPTAPSDAVGAPARPDGGPWHARCLRSGDVNAANNVALAVAALRGPHVYITIGGTLDDHRGIYWNVPEREYVLWIHRGDAADLTAASLHFCWIAATDPLPASLEARSERALRAMSAVHGQDESDGGKDDDNDGDLKRATTTTAAAATTRFSRRDPLVSVFTSSFRSGDKILRLYDSLINQDYPNWELVVVDDSGDGEVTYREWLLPHMPDTRVRRIRMDARSGYIGSVKRLAASACVGEILVEADHDDRLTPQCLRYIVNALEANWDCGFAFAETAESFAVDGSPHWYDSKIFVGGLGLQWRQWIPMINCWLVGSRTVNQNRGALTHLMYMPNHPRVWTADCYRLAGGHRVGLSVADDYDLLVRTALVTRWVRINEVCYVQYRNNEGDNHTVLRNEQIQTLCAMLHAYYLERLLKRMDALGAPLLTNEDIEANRNEVPLWVMDPTSAWYRGMESVHNVTGTGPDKQVAHIYVLTKNDRSAGARARALLMAHLERHRIDAVLWNDNPIVVVGDDLPDEQILLRAAQMIPRDQSAGLLRWWPLEGYNMAQCAAYGKLLVSHIPCTEVIDGTTASSSSTQRGSTRITADRALVVENQWGVVEGPPRR